MILRQKLVALTPESERYLADAFFPIGLYDVPESALQEVAAAGFNLVVNGDKEPPYLFRAEAAGIRVIPYVNTDDMAADARKAKVSRALFAWYLFDEPDLNDVSPEEYRELLAQLRKADETRPVYLTVVSSKNFAVYADGCGILAPNPYPIRHLEAEENDLCEVARAVDRARAAAGTRPVWAVIQTFWAEPIWLRNPTPDELRAMTFLALNHGASGIIYFSYKSGDRPITQHRELFAAIRELNGQISALRGALLAPTVKWDFDVQVLQETAPPEAMPLRIPERPVRLDCSLRAFRDAHLLIAVNPDSWGKKADIALPRTFPGLEIAELFGGPDAVKGPRCGERVELDFQPYQVRIFWIR
jgi:hypothetical protein